ncbi:hypothetical protein OBBRIDRAFT_779350 [Obba rivulosa]|uniref:Csf1 N-terminal domain-containing protein n=1 Tax=Obba rivulosa TaxID=1052685 RepID=A0A8E2DKH4_9APHY|nr:hypothetical protein OBBRIDRAFT_779350 [Obba rivulosa]
MLNFVLLAVAICIIIALIFHLFYWNRLIGYIIGLLFRLAFWSRHDESSIWLDIGSIHFSMLNGRVMFKDLRYHSSNQTIRIVKGQLSWRYWIRKPAEEEDLSHARVVGEDTNMKGSAPLSCRVHMSVQGLEWFMYNRTAAYDNIVSQLERDTMSSPGPTPAPTPVPPNAEGWASVRNVFSRSSGRADASILGPPISLVSSIYMKTPAFIRRAISWVHLQLPKLDPKELLPISFETTKAAIICGNVSTPSLLVVELSKAEGTYGIVEARSKFDQYKQMLNVRLHNPSVWLMKNEDYHEQMNNVGRKVQEHLKRAQTPHAQHRTYLSFFSFHKLWYHLNLQRVMFQTATRTFWPHSTVPKPHPPGWARRKANKAKDDETPLGAEFTTMEYAIERKILDAPLVEMLYYADVVGIVPFQPEQQSSKAGTEGLDPFDIGNGDLPPEWGVDIVIKEGTLRYGPWADRQRVNLQRVFFPLTYHDIQTTPRLKPGDMRMWTGLKVFIELRDGVTLQMPFREPSKNWQWDGKVQVPHRPRKREPATIHVRAGDSSTISYILPMVAGPTGYESSLELHLDTVTVTSSLNDIRLITAETCRLRCHLPTPLRRDGERRWTFTSSLRQASLYLLRDHINMLTDLGKDWTAGPPSDYHHFIPIVYVFNLDMQQYEINTYVNDHNIIDKPLIKEDNALLTLRGKHFRNEVRLPFTKYRPEATTLAFWVEAPDVAVSLTLPRWNTYSLWPALDRTKLGRIGLLRLDASYRSFADVRGDNVDRLKLGINVRDIVYQAFGWSVRHFMILRDNYFGSFTHFSTLYEYLEKRKEGLPVGDPVTLQYREGSSNPLQVELDVNMESGIVILPAGLPGFEVYTADQVHDSQKEDLGTSLFFRFPVLQAQLRVHDSYMEMSLNVDPVCGWIEAHCYQDSLMSHMNREIPKELIVLDGIDITAHRLFGPRPHNKTYVCVWEIHLGGVKAIFDAYEAQIASAAMSSFSMNYSDSFNAPAKEFVASTDPDVTFTKVTIESIVAVWTEGPAAIELSLPDGLKIDTNDLPGMSYSKVNIVRAPSASLKALLASKTSRHKWHEAMSVSFDANLDIYSTPSGWEERAQKQRAFVAEQDRPTGRVKFIYSGSVAPEDGRPPLVPIGDYSSVYLPPLRLPTISRAKRGNNVLNKTRHGRSRLARKDQDFLSSQTTYRAESDADEILSNLDGDLFPETPRPQSDRVDTWNEDDASMSTGDESDDESLTDPQDWESEDSDWTHEDLHDEPAVQFIREYARFVKCYTSTSLARPSLWDESPFLASSTKASKHFDFPRTQDAEGRDRIAKTVLAQCRGHAEAGRHFRGSLVRLFSEGSKILVTPLIVSVVERIASNLGNKYLSPELGFDSIMARCAKCIGSKRRDIEEVTSFDICLTGIKLRSAQIVSLEAPLQLAMNRKQSSDSSRSKLTIAELLIDGLRFRGRPPQRSPDSNNQSSCALSFESFNLTLAAKHGFHTGNISPPEVNVALGYSRMHLTSQELDLSLGSSTMEVDHTAPGIICAVVVVLCPLINRSKTVLSRMSANRTAHDLHILQHVLISSRQQPVIDPLSTIQPSYLVQKGLPDMLRKNVLFKVLVHLRNCLRCLEAPERQALSIPPTAGPTTASLQEVISNMESQYIELGVDEDSSSLSQHSLLRELFPALDTSSQRRDSPITSPPLTTLSVTLDSAVVNIRHPINGLRSQFSMHSLAILAHLRSSTLLQFSTANLSKSHAALISHEKERTDLRYLPISINLGAIACTIVPQCMQFVQVLLRESRSRRSAIRHDTPNSPQYSTSAASGSLEKQPSVLYVDITLLTQSVRITASAEALLIEFTTSGVTYASNSLIKMPAHHDETLGLSLNHSLSFEKAALQACSAVDVSKIAERHALASITILNGKLNMVLQRDILAKMTLRLILGLRSLHFDVPRSALRLYRFIEGWRADYLPGIDAAVQDLLAEYHSAPKPAPSRPSASSPHPGPASIQIQASLSSAKMTLQIMRGTWLSWDVLQTAMYLTTASDSRRKQTFNFGVQMGPHLFAILTKSQSTPRSAPSDRIKLELPVITLRFRYDDQGIHGMALVEFFHLTVRPSDWDTLLSVQQKFDQDFNDFVHLIEETRKKRTNPTDSPPTIPRSAPRFHGSFRMKGFRVGLEALSSTLFLECDDINGGHEDASRSLWQFKLSDLALSLASRSRLSSTLDRGHRSAFVTVDIQARMENGSTGDQLQILVTKVHAVMQPSSIGELGDFVDYLQAEVLTRKEERANDLAQFKEKTRSIMRSLDVKLGEPQRPGAPWFDRYSITMAVRNIGVAFPLTMNKELHLPRSGSQDETAVRAFLFAIKSLEFGTQRGETGQATMKGFSFQFISRFRQSVPAHFSADTHHSHNRLLYPDMTAHLRSERTSLSRRIRIGADVSGFVLDLDSAIPEYVFSLIDVYRQGKERMERFTSSIPRSAGPVQERTAAAQAAGRDQYEALPTSNLLLSLTFASGQVRMHSRTSMPELSRSRSTSAVRHANSQHRGEDGMEVFSLPVVSVWGEYRATPASHKLASHQHIREPSTLMFKSTIHSSQNTLKPTLLPFITDLVERVERRIRQASWRNTPQASPMRPLELLPSVSADIRNTPAPAPVSSMKISFSLRIDQSRLELTCQPDVNVIAGLHWDSGGFVVNVSPGARQVAFTGSVGGLTIGLRHGFLSEDCVRLDARNLSFNMDFAKMESSTDKASNSISVIVDTEFSGAMRFSRLQDVLCFKAVWLDRIPVFSGQTGLSTDSTTKGPVLPTPSISTSGQQALTTVVLLRIRQVQLDVDLGQSISATKLNIYDTLMRTKVSETGSELTLSTGDVAINASGNVSGRVNIPYFRFQTIRRSSNTSAVMPSGKMLDLTMTTGILDIELESEFQTLIRYSRAEPVSIHIYDDWTRMSPEIPLEERRVDVAFTVSGTDVLLIMHVGTIPRLVSYAAKFKANLEAQKEGASRESKAFRIASSPKPDNPLSAVANAMLKSARSRLKEAESGFSCVIGQRMSLRLDHLQLALFPRSMRDAELALMTAREVHACLDRLIGTDAAPAKRDLELSFSSIATSRITHLNNTLASKEKSANAKDWLAVLIKGAPEAIIYSLPSMHIRMRSEETIRDRKRVLAYEFTSKFAAEAGAKPADDIYITLNMSLYSWLTILRKTFAREMEQVAADNRTAPTALAVHQLVPSRKKHTEPLTIVTGKEEDVGEGRRPTGPVVQPRSPRGSISTSCIQSPALGSPIIQDKEKPAVPLTSPSASPGANKLASPVIASVRSEASAAVSTSAHNIIYEPHSRHIERLTLRQLGEATPDVMHPFFMKKAGFSLEDSLPQYVHEYATMPTEEIMEALLKLYSKQLGVERMADSLS